MITRYNLLWLTQKKSFRYFRYRVERDLIGVTILVQAKGNAAFSNGDFEEAIEHFTNGINADGSNHVLYSNRSAAQANLPY